MASRIEHRAEFPEGVAEVLAAQAGEDVLRARLAEIGGTNASLLEHTVTDDGVRFRLRQGIAADALPQAARSLLNGDLVVEREQSFRRTDTGYAGTAKATVGSIPGGITARTEIVPGGAGTVLRNTGEVTVRIPLLGGKLEGVIAEQVTKLLQREAEFTAEWLRKQS